MFDFVDINLKELEVDPINKDGVRYYPIPGADKYYPSVTSITSFKNAAFFAGLRKKIGEDSKLMFCGDITQTDLTREKETSGISDFINILQNMKKFACVEFGLDDIVRSGLVKEYLIAKYTHFGTTPAGMS